MMTATLLIVDDDAGAREGLRMTLESSGHRLLTAANGTEALRVVKESPIDVVISDIKMPGMDGMELFQKIRVLSPATSVILVTAYGEIETAVKAMKEGAFDYIAKPVHLEEIELSVARALVSAQLKRENEDLRQQLQSGFPGLVAQSKAMQRILHVAQAVAPTKATVLLEGETGTGKEVLARAIHEASPRRQALFVAVNCAALPETLLESELFGHERGAFTGAEDKREGRFERAHRGTLFLDEITECPLPAQVKLLRVLQEQAFERVGGSKTLTVDVRVIAASNVAVQKRVEEGTFREDLYYRLHVVSILIPPLRERREDIPLLVSSLLKDLCRQHGKVIREVTPRVMEILQAYRWPGNVRQLRNSLETMVVLSQEEALSEKDIPPDILSESPKLQTPMQGVENPWKGRTLEEIERLALVEALRDSGGNRALAAQALGVSRSSLYRMMSRYALAGKSKE